MWYFFFPCLLSPRLSLNCSKFQEGRGKDKDEKQLDPEEPIAKIIKYLGGIKVYVLKTALRRPLSEALESPSVSLN